MLNFLNTFLWRILMLHPSHTSLFLETVTIKFRGPRDRGPRADIWGRGPRAEKNKYPLGYLTKLYEDPQRTLKARVKALSTCLP